MVYTLRFFSSKCSLFHNSNIFGSCIIHILYTVCAKIKKNNSGAKRLTGSRLVARILVLFLCKYMQLELIYTMFKNWILNNTVKAPCRVCSTKTTRLILLQGITGNALFFLIILIYQVIFQTS